MLFPSFAFVFAFLPVTLAGAWWTGRREPRAAVLWLAFSSLVFYGAWDARFVLLLVASIAFNFSLGRRIARGRAEGSPTRGLLAAGIAANLAVLGCFKYAGFFLETAAALGMPRVPAPHIVLPLGISFFTFTQIAFLVDVHRGEAREYRAPEYALFVTWFPHLIAGPLLHHGQLVPQFSGRATFRFDARNVALGLSLFAIGLAKKVLIADELARYAAPVFDAAQAGGGPRLVEAWIGALGYTLQLYFDFSGYSEMAMGISLLFNVRLPFNFDSPYKAASIIEFWQRWHITLSSFLRDYLYIPLGGNRRGKPRRYANLMATMLLGGLWHGAAWTFVAWGGLHGVYLCVNHAWRGARGRRSGGAWTRTPSVALTFLAVVAGWVLFRAESFAAAASILAGMAGLHGVSVPPEAMDVALVRALLDGRAVTQGFAPLTHIDGRDALPAIAMALAIAWLLPNVRQIFAGQPIAVEPVCEPARPVPALQRVLLWRGGTGQAVALGALFFLCLFRIGVERTPAFLYFQF